MEQLVCMMRKIKLVILAIFALNLIWGQNLIFYAHKTFFPDKVHLYCNVLEPTTVHVFIDYATTPTLFQMVQLLRLPEKDVKFVSWSRYPARKQKAKGALINVYEKYLPPFFLKNKEVVIDFIEKINKSCANVVWEFHFNYKHIGWHSKIFLENIPVDKVKRVHL